MSGENAKADPYQAMLDHVHRYRESNGADGHDFGDCKCLLLETIGRKSGELRTVALVYGERGEDYILVGSKGGASSPPDWFFNLMAQPEVMIQVGPDRQAVVARLARTEERPALWNIMLDQFAKYADYEIKSGRQLDVVVLSPCGPLTKNH